jgi:hypothetical protein
LGSALPGRSRAPLVTGAALTAERHGSIVLVDADRATAAVDRAANMVLIGSSCFVSFVPEIEAIYNFVCPSIIKVTTNLPFSFGKNTQATSRVGWHRQAIILVMNDK